MLWEDLLCWSAAAVDAEEDDVNEDDAGEECCLLLSSPHAHAPASAVAVVVGRAEERGNVVVVVDGRVSDAGNAAGKCWAKQEDSESGKHSADSAERGKRRQRWRESVGGGSEGPWLGLEECSDGGGGTADSVDAEDGKRMKRRTDRKKRKETVSDDAGCGDGRISRSFPSLFLPFLWIFEDPT